MVEKRGVGTHERIIAPAQYLCEARLDWASFLMEVVQSLSDLNEGSTRAYVTSKCCVNAPKQHVAQPPYFRRVGRGAYESKHSSDQRKTNEQ